MTDRRSFDDVVGAVPDDTERQRLEQVHRLLQETGPAPEPSPAVKAQLDALKPRRPTRATRTRVLVAVTAAVGLLAVSFGLGLVVGGDSSRRAVDAERVLPMRGESGASAKLALFSKDEAGNWPMLLTAQGLPALPAGRAYELWLTRGGRLSEPCGIFVVSTDGKTKVWLNAPYELDGVDGWVVVEHGHTTPLLTT